LKGAMDRPASPSFRDDAKREWLDLQQKAISFPENIFDNPSIFSEQLIIDAIIEAVFYEVFYPDFTRISCFFLLLNTILKYFSCLLVRC
jgi:hypothetical protein